MVWLATIGITGSDIQYVRSTDGGVTFSPPVSVVGDDAGGVQDFPSLAVDSNNVLYIAWVDGRDIRKGTSNTDQIYMTKSTDGGASFAEPKRASNMPGGIGGSCECCNTSTAVSPDGDVYIAFRSNMENIRDVFVARSRDGGETFGTAIRAASESWELFACPMAGPVIALDRKERLHIMWKDGRPSAEGKQYIYYTLLPKDADACLFDRRLYPGAIQTNYPTLGIAPSGEMVCTFENFQDGRLQGLYMVSGDGGNGFEFRGSLTAGLEGVNQEMPVIVAGPSGERYIVWQDDRRGNTDIWFVRDDSPITRTLPERVELLGPNDGATIDADGYLSWDAPANLPAGSSNVLYTLRLESVSEPGTVMTLDDLVGTTYRPEVPDGTYRWSVTAETLIGSAPPSQTRTFTLSGTSSVGNRESGEEEPMVILPNPVTDPHRLHLEFSPSLLQETGAELSIVDLSGRRLLHFSRDQLIGSGPSLDLDAGSLVDGMYFLVFRSDERRIVRSLLLVR